MAFTDYVNALFDEDAGGNSAYSRLMAEVEYNKNTPPSDQATDTSLTIRDIRIIGGVVEHLRELRHPIRPKD